jgi:hypothetical protein
MPDCLKNSSFDVLPDYDKAKLLLDNMTSIAKFGSDGVRCSVLGWSAASWTRQTLRTILNHHGSEYTGNTSKLDLMRCVCDLAHRHGLNSSDRVTTLKSTRKGQLLPPLKPVLLTAIPAHLGSGPTYAQWRAMAKARKARDKESQRQARPNHIGALVATGSTPTTGAECVICLESLDPTYFPKRKITLYCAHEPNVCLQCLSQSISTQLTSKVWDQIDCPSCSARLDFLDIRTFADLVVFERYS